MSLNVLLLYFFQNMTDAENFETWIFTVYFTFPWNPSSIGLSSQNSYQWSVFWFIHNNVYKAHGEAAFEIIDWNPNNVKIPQIGPGSLIDCR